MPEAISSDNTFYSCISEDLQKEEILYHILTLYPFYLGKNILRELPSSIKDREDFRQLFNYIEGDFFELIRPFFGRSKEHETDGEYEAIAIAYHLENRALLKYLILDEPKARNFLNSHFPVLTPKSVRSFRFLKNSSCEDNVIPRAMVIEIFETLIETIEGLNERNEGGEIKRPCGMNLNNYQDIVIPVLNEVRAWKDRNGL